MFIFLLFFSKRKDSLHPFPLSVSLSQMETIANIWPAHEEDITSHRFLWSVWFGSAEKGDAPQSPIHTCEPAPACLGKAKLDQNGALGFGHLDLLSSPSLPKRAPHWPHLWDIKELKQLQEESATNYASQTAVNAGPALFRRWVWNSVWIWQATLTQLCIHGGNGEYQSFGRTSLFAGDEHTSGQDIWQKSHSLLGTISSSFSHLLYGKSGCLLRGMEGVIFLGSAEFG